MSAIGDDRVVHVVPFVLERLQIHRNDSRFDEKRTPLMLGINGIQGCGKSTLVDRLQQELTNEPHNLNVVVFSIDDFYLTHADQQTLAKSQPENPLVQQRGQPSTHDVGLCTDVIDSLRNNHRTVVPVYDKSAFSGQGDRSQSSSVVVDPEATRNIDVIILEGWFMGFRPLDEAEIKEKWERACSQINGQTRYDGRLGHNKLESVLFVNKELEKYDRITDRFDALIHIDAEDTHYVYDWRLEAERQLIQRTGSGMTDDQVKTFIDGYYPSYELYTEALRAGAFPRDKGKQIRLVVNKARKVVQVQML